MISTSEARRLRLQLDYFIPGVEPHYLKDSLSELINDYIILKKFYEDHTQRERSLARSKQLTHNQEIEGSNPSAPIKEKL